MDEAIINYKIIMELGLIFVCIFPKIIRYNSSPIIIANE